MSTIASFKPGGSRASLIIVDDSESALSYLTALVATNIADCDAVPFTNSAAALDHCVNTDVDLIIVDYMMPAPNGLAFIERYRTVPSRRDVPIIMVTTEDYTDVRYKALQLGATDFLSKPVDPIEFVTRTRNLLSLSRSRKALARRAECLAEEVRRATRSIIERERETILFLCRAAEHRDPETASHLKRMASYSRLIASKLGCDGEEAELIFAAAPMHDIGKIGIPDNILLKPDRLTDDEIAVMRCHTTFGWEILADSQSSLLQVAADIAHSHHERYDGSGYPRRLGGERISLAGRITALADVFDALTTPRPYKRAWSLDEARAYVHANRGSHFDPGCVDALFAAWDEVRATARVFQIIGQDRARPGIEENDDDGPGAVGGGIDDRLVIHGRGPSVLR